MDDVREKMEKAMELLREDLATVRAGRATPALVEKIMVEAYETRMPLVELATISSPEPNQLVIAPFDPTVLRNIEIAITHDRGLGLSAIVDENVIRIQIPPLTEEKRKEMVKLLSQKLESGRMMVRQARQEKVKSNKLLKTRKWARMIGFV
jgi:ribosome recycling factor